MLGTPWCEYAAVLLHTYNCALSKADENRPLHSPIACIIYFIWRGKSSPDSFDRHVGAFVFVVKIHCHRSESKMGWSLCVYAGKLEKSGKVRDNILH